MEGVLLGAVLGYPMISTYFPFSVCRFARGLSCFLNTALGQGKSEHAKLQKYSFRGISGVSPWCQAWF